MVENTGLIADVTSHRRHLKRIAITDIDTRQYKTTAIVIASRNFFFLNIASSSLCVCARALFIVQYAARIEAAKGRAQELARSSAQGNAWRKKAGVLNSVRST